MKTEVNDDYFQECVDTLQQLIQIPSVKTAAMEHYPFGKPIGQALDFFLEKAKEFGFHTRNLDGYAGIVEMGEGDQELGILVHLDVVPAGEENDWRHKPFSGIIDEGAIWGRGILDDKGPAAAVLYAMKLVMDSGVSWNKRVRLIIGTDEESSWKDIEYYKRYEKPPAIAFTPDGCFPVTNSEKGIITIQYQKRCESPSIVSSIHSGERYNITPAVATAVLQLNYNGFMKKHHVTNKHITVRPDANGNCLMTANGRSGRSSAPVVTDNAIHILLTELKLVLAEDDSFLEIIDFYETYLQYIDGRGHGCQLSDDVSGELTLATCKLDWDGSLASFVSNIRYPSTYKMDDIIMRCSKMLEASLFTWEVLEHKEAVYVPAESPFIQELLAIYNDYFDSQEQPQSISGGTYARAFPNTVAFGALIPGKPLNAHEINENVELQVIRDWIAIYAQTIFNLAADGLGESGLT